MRPSGQKEASLSLGAANCETAATFVGPWVVQRSGVIRRSECGVAAPEGCELRNCRWFRWLLGSPAECCHTQIRMRPRRPRWPRIAKPSPRSWAPGGSSGVVPHAHQNEASLALKGLRTAKVSPRSWAPGRSGGVASHADQNEASPSPGAANCETVATFVCPRWVQRSGVMRISS